MYSIIDEIWLVSHWDAVQKRKLMTCKSYQMYIPIYDKAIKYIKHSPLYICTNGYIKVRNSEMFKCMYNIIDEI